MLKISSELFFDERMVWNQSVGNFVPQKRKLNAPKKIGTGGKIPKGDDKYNLIIQKPVLVEYENGVVCKETRVINWKTMSRYIRERDKKCVKCGSTRNLEADHFHPCCYFYVNWFFRASKIQTLCSMCHVALPKMNQGRAENWKKYVWI